MKKENKLVKSLFLALALTMFGGTAPDGVVAPVMAQQVTGTLGGTVTDEQGAVIPGAQVVAKNIATGTETTTTSNENGIYRIAALTPGDYVVKVVADGFKTIENSGVTVKLGGSTGLDVAMQVGGQSDIVEVSGGEVLIERDTSQISANYDSRKVADLPNTVGGGGIDTLALLTPGVVDTGDAGFSNSNGTGISANGGRGRSNNFNIDGQDNNDISVAGPAVGVDNADIVQEFQIVTNNFSAEYGQAGSAVINIITKGGSNEFHGNLSYFFRDRKNLSTLTVQERASGLEEAPFQLSNTFNMSLGGPVVKDKLFFFASYQGIRIAEGTFAQSTAAGLALTPNGIATARQFVSPAIANVISQGSPFALGIGNPTIRPDVATRLINVNIGGRMVPLEFGAIQRTIQTPFEENFSTFRADYNASDKLRISARYLYQKGESANATGNFTNGFIGDVPSRSQQLGVTAIYQVSPRATNEFRFNYSRLRVSFGGGGGATIPSASDADQAFGFFNLPAGFLDIGVATNLPQGRINDNYQFLNNFSLTSGKHTYKAGVDFKRRLTESSFLPNQNGTYNFNSLATFFNNTPNSINIAVGPNILNFTEFDQAYYFEDVFRVKDNFTLTLGIRYENTGQPINILNEITSKREGDPSTAIFRQDVPLEARVFPAIDTDNNNFAPRIGFAYTPRLNFAKAILGENKTVIRGGYGISYDLAFYNILLNSATAAPVVFATSITGTGVPPVPTDPTGPGIRASVLSRVPTGTSDPRLLTQTGVANDFHNPYTQQFSLGVQRQFGNNTILEVRYVGTRGVGLFQSVNGNPLISTLARDFGTQFLPNGVRPSPNGRLIADRGLFRNRINGANSIYHSMQVRFDTRIKNLIFGTSYSFSKQIDNASEIFGTFGGGSTSAFAQDPFNVGAGERALGAYDFRHVFSTNFIYSIPLLPALRGNKIAEKLLGGYEVSGTFRANTGQNFTPTQFFFGSPYVDRAFANAFNSGVEFVRPFLGNPNAPASSIAIDSDTAINVFGFTNTPSPTGFYLLNSFNGSPNSPPVPVTLDQVRFIANTAFTSRLFGTPYGNAARNSLKGDELFLGNFAFFKNTKISERMNLQFRAEMFNVFNHPNFGVPDPFIDDAGVGFNDINFNDSGRRTIQFGLKLLF